MADQFGLQIETFDRAALEGMGAGALLAVAQGSIQPPQMLVVRHPGKGPLSLFAGKGITFDSGGISLKPREDMHLMKGDMCGAAAVLGAMRAIAAVGADVNVVAIAALAENMPGGRALKPGDVITAMNGKTIEVQNTDAEGRLVLADALAYGAKLEPAAMVDLATLTGACIIALGHLATGVMGTSEALIGQIRQAGEAAGERMWELPFYPEYREQMKSDVADIRNIGGRPAGAITGGIFLKEFADDKPWAHLDIAGTAWQDDGTPYLAKGATGVGVHTLLNLAEALADGRVNG
jgi:leucyl aminopeptidase